MMTREELRALLSRRSWGGSSFDTLRAIAGFAARNSNEGRELVIRALAQQDDLDPQLLPILHEISKSVGLYPYVPMDEKKSLRDIIEHAAHQAEGHLSEVVLHRAQARVLQMLVDGKSVILSAPTSYGKSLLIDATIAAKNFDVVVIIVPTIALIEETRRRMTRFSDRYDIISNAGQRARRRAIYVLTQERFLAMKEEIPAPNFFVIDEFYKLSPSDRPNDRTSLLNHVMRILAESGAQFYLLGPSIQAIPDSIERNLKCTFVVDDFQTVAIESHILSKKPSKQESLRDLLHSISGRTLIYCQSPASARRLAGELLELGLGSPTEDDELRSAADWISRHYHAEWRVTRALRKSIGIHHGQMPRALARFMIRMFEEGKIELLICTSTLIEGVNTSARNVVIYDNKIDNRRLDFFTFNNIRGRSGRMFKHFVGHVYMFDKAPTVDLPFVDIPAYNPTVSTPSSLLIHIDADELPLEAAKKIEPIVKQNVLPIEMLREIRGIEPEFLLAAATTIGRMRDTRVLEWTGMPSYDELYVTSELIWDDMGGSHGARKAGVLSSGMMTFLAHRLAHLRDVGAFQREQIAERIRRGGSADEAVESVLAYLRRWASFSYPKYLHALNTVANYVLGRRGRRGCNYTVFATSIEHLFRPTTIGALEEYGIPAELSDRFMRAGIFGNADDLDTVLERLKSAGIVVHTRSIFERRIAEDFLAGIGAHV